MASDCACVAPSRFVTPSSRDVNAYALLTILIGPDTLVTEICADPFATWSTEKLCTSGFFMYFEFVQEYVPFRPTVSGK